ncbi:Cas10/Cmr2 second palm domain-containing protein [Lyngbya confervoides]|uniref:CRISPR-associated protein Cas10 n=1 Tax=Lyngbya confervoides BDU141951 TaxID=1574623 RepID=A0ABD4T5E6_9CYAN|nr:type III-B CRISPR-associated protein Cas10/Cmr2 [Lyngbya confervoides]MCM1983651.1 CRISPR-associated protein Cas10 [Lyngbya confervoides BDU141951]
MPDLPYTIITFAPVQGFIEKSRKLRDLYGSSFLLSYLARSLHNFAIQQQLQVIAPATTHLTQGIPNQLIIKGDLPQEQAQQHFQHTWAQVVTTCRQTLERKIRRDDYQWKRAWDNWKNHCWEFFWVQSDPGGSISEARQRMNDVKRARAWTGINWVGESSTLSGMDAIAWPGMLDRTHPKYRHGSAATLKAEIDEFYQQLSAAWGTGFFDETERLSIPELIKRLITHPEVQNSPELKGDRLPEIDNLQNFTDLNRLDNPRWTGWFQGDGDSIGDYLRRQAGDSADPAQEEAAIQPFSTAMIEWAKDFKEEFDQNEPGRIIYAGGDDFLGVLYQGNPLTLADCLDWLYQFPDLWRRHRQPITVSVGFVWAAPGVPQRDILQHCKQAEKSAKQQGRDRVALRILFNGGNHLQWSCPWHLLKPILTAYRDREGHLHDQSPNWTHLNEDVQALRSRHAFTPTSSLIALELFKIYFPHCSHQAFILDPNRWYNPDPGNPFQLDPPYHSGILGQKTAASAPQAEFNQWLIDLAQISLHLSPQTTPKSAPPSPTASGSHRV